MMKFLNGIAISVLITAMCLCLCIGYAVMTDQLTIMGSATTTPFLPDLYISKMTPKSSAGVTVDHTVATAMFASIDGGGTATFTVNIVNTSNIVYVFDRVIDGAEANIDGVYSGTDITYELDNLAPLDEIAPNGGTLSFDITITVPEGVSAEYYFLKFHFVEKFSAPGEEHFPTEMPSQEVALVQRLSDILNNIYKMNGIASARDYLIDETIQVRWEPGANPYVGSKDQNYTTQLNRLFGDLLRDQSLSFILKNEDINWDGYSEIALYSTSDLLDSQSEWANDGVVCVYVTVFTPVLDDQRHIVGYQLVCNALRGYCYEVRYGSNDLTPSFSTDEWRDDVGYMESWDDQANKPILASIPDDTMNADGSKLFKLDYNSYNRKYLWYNTAPYGKTLRECLAGLLP